MPVSAYEVVSTTCSTLITPSRARLSLYSFASSSDPSQHVLVEVPRRGSLWVRSYQFCNARCLTGLSHSGHFHRRQNEPSAVYGKAMGGVSIVLRSACLLQGSTSCLKNPYEENNSEGKNRTHAMKPTRKSASSTLRLSKLQLVEPGFCWVIKILRCVCVSRLIVLPVNQMLILHYI